GLAVVQAKSRTREAILEALRSRRCYATSGVKILLDFRVDGHPMGSAIEGEGERKVHVRVLGTTDLKTVEVVGPEGALHEVAADGPRAEAEIDLEAAYLYLRVRQQDGEMAWSSPVFMGDKRTP
ncbi:MAG: DUF3604 domain-containing protein, partial [Myxococcales bacterium]|nr:DUF3604 domain-containing protein [Myxococcales bacterium]